MCFPHANITLCLALYALGAYIVVVAVKRAGRGRSLLVKPDTITRPMFTREWLELPSKTDAVECHVLPCSIKFEGAVDKSKFEITREPELTSWLRGRRLHGYEVDLAKRGYQGFTIHAEEAKEELQDPEEEEVDVEPSQEEPPLMQATRLVPVGRAFDRIVVWEHGQPPLKSDAWGEKLEALLEFAKYTS